MSATKEHVLNVSEQVRAVAREQGLVLTEREVDKAARGVLMSLRDRGMASWVWEEVVATLQGTPKWEKYLEAKGK